jgi:hypothetical protein
MELVRVSSAVMGIEFSYACETGKNMIQLFSYHFYCKFNNS